MLVRATREEWRGYAVTATRDALLRLTRPPESDAVELYATDGGPEWALAWLGTLSAANFTRSALTPPIAIEDADFRELDQLARGFAADWIWFSSAGREEIAIERERYARYGYPVSAANVRTSKLHGMRGGAVEGKRLVHSSLRQDELWVKELILATWAAQD
jgi:hypothetical protein